LGFQTPGTGWGFGKPLVLIGVLENLQYWLGFQKTPGTTVVSTLVRNCLISWHIIA